MIQVGDGCPTRTLGGRHMRHLCSGKRSEVGRSKLGYMETIQLGRR